MDRHKHELHIKSPKTKMFHKLQSRQFNASGGHQSPESLYWDKFRRPSGLQVELNGPVVGVAFSASGSFDFALASGTRVFLHDGRTGKLRKTLSRFKDVACGVSFRHDGKLVASGCANGHVYVFETASGNLLRVLKGHKAAVRASGWAMEGSSVLSCSDDKLVKFWDVSLEAEIGSWVGHSDQVRCCSLLDGAKNVWATGSYDHSVKVWDIRAPGGSDAKISLAQGAPVEAVLAMNSGRSLLAAAGNTIRVWDLAFPDKPVKEIVEHQRAVTTLFKDGTKARILSGSLDGMLKVHDATSFETIGSVAVGTGQGVLSAGISKDNLILAIGCVSGKGVIKKRNDKNSEQEGNFDDREEENRKNIVSTPNGGTSRYFMRGGNVGPSANDFKVVSKKRKKLQIYDRHLKDFNYKKALDEVLKTKQPMLVAALLQELVHRNGLEAALMSRSDVSLEPLLSYLIKFVANPRYSNLLIDVCGSVTSMYAKDLGQSVLLDDLFLKLQKQLQQEVRFQKDLQKMSGTIDLILSSR